MPPPSIDAPTLHADSVDAIRVKWTLPRGMATSTSGFVAVSLKADGDSTWHRVDAATGKLDDGPDALPVMLPSTQCVVRGVDPSVKYFAKVRLADTSGWSPDSAPSKGLMLTSLFPIAPGEPVLEAVDETSMRVHFTLPPKRPGAPDHVNVGVFVRADDGAWQAVDVATSTLMKPVTAQTRPASWTVADVKGLSADVTYDAMICVTNTCGRSPPSAVSEVLTLASLRPVAAAAPVLEAVDETSMRVHFTTPPVRPGAPKHSSVAVWIRAGDGAWRPLDAATSKIGSGKAHRTSCTMADVKGLSAGETYHAKISVKNACGWGDHSAVSEGLKLPGPEVECTGSRTLEERNAELRKRAVDVEAETESMGASRSVSRLPPEKRVKSE